MKIEAFEKAFDDDKGLYPLSTQQASNLIKKYSIYFTIKLKSEFMFKHLPYMNLEDKYEIVYQLDNTKSFNEQLKQIHSYIDINYESYAFFTDYKESESLVIQKLDLAKELIESRNQKVTLSRLKQETKINDIMAIHDYLKSFEIYKQGDLFA